MFHALTVVEEDSVVDAIREISKRYARAEDLYDALKWRLARQPESGVRYPGTSYYVVKTDTLADYVLDVPVIRVLYSIGEEQIVISAVDIVDAPAGDVD